MVNQLLVQLEMPTPRRRVRLRLLRFWRRQALAKALLSFWWIAPLAGWVVWTEYRLWELRGAVVELVETSGVQHEWNEEVFARVQALTGFEIERQLDEQRFREQAQAARRF